LTAVPGSEREQQREGDDRERLSAKERAQPIVMARADWSKEQHTESDRDHECHDKTDSCYALTTVQRHSGNVTENASQATISS
jgi:hypothetical protein